MHFDARVDRKYDVEYTVIRSAVAKDAFMRLSMEIILPAVSVILFTIVSLPQLHAAQVPDAARLQKNARVVDGFTVSISDGNAFLYDRANGRWSFMEQLYDPQFFTKNYTVKDGKVFCRDEVSGSLFEMRKKFRSGFEEARTLRDLIGEKYGFTSFVLQSPRAPTVPEYVRLRKDILQGRSDFLDNRVEPSTEMPHSGTQSLRVSSVAKSFPMVCAKAHIECELLHFAKGDNYWFSGWYNISSGKPYTISDIKSAWIKMTPGLRLVLENGVPEFELKWMDKPRYRQMSASPVQFPRGRWVHIVIHLTLSDEDDGVNELWLDGAKIIAAKGRNLPLADTIYNHLEVGITATHEDAVVLVDDIEVSDTPLLTTNE